MTIRVRTTEAQWAAAGASPTMTIGEDGVALPARALLNFDAGLVATDNPSAGRIDVTLSGVQGTSEKDQPDGYAGLDASGLLDPAQIPDGSTGSSGTFQAGQQPAALFSPLPGLVKNTLAGYNGGQNLVTARGYEYAIWVRDDGHPVIAQRRVGRATWTTPTDLSAILGTQVADGHNHYSIAVDGNGAVHVSGNMHAVALKYARSNTPDSVAAFTAQTMAGANIDSVTYPRFLMLANGDLLFHYRNGVSGSGDKFIKRWTVASGTWANVMKLIDGISSGESAYTSDLVVSQDGTKVGLAGNWRAGSTPLTNADVWFIQSTNGGLTWTSITGAPVTVPMTHAGSPLAYPHPQNTGLLNTANMDWDSNGRPHLAFLDWDTSGKSNVRHVWWNGSAWLNEIVTFGTWLMDLNPPPIDGAIIVDGTVARPGIACSANGSTYITWRTVKDGKRGSYRLVDVTVPGSPVEFPIVNLDVGYQELLVFDQPALRNSGRLRCLLSPQPFALAGQGDYGDAVNWGAQWGGILDLDIVRIRDWQAAQGGRPSIRITQIASLPFGSTATANSTTPVDVNGLPLAIVLPEHANSKRQLLVKMNAKIVKATAGTGTWSIVQRDSAGAVITTLSSVTVAATTGIAIMETPWVPVQLASLIAGGTLTVRGVSSDTNTTTLSAVMLQVGMIQDANGALTTG